MNDTLQEKIKKLHLSGMLQTADMRAKQAVTATIKLDDLIRFHICQSWSLLQ